MSEREKCINCINANWNDRDEFGRVRCYAGYGHLGYTEPDKGLFTCDDFKDKNK